MRSRWACAPPVSPSPANPNKAEPAARVFAADRPSRQARVVPVVRVARAVVPVRAASEAAKHRVPAGLGFVVDKPLVVVLGLAAEPVRPASGAVKHSRPAPAERA